MSMKNYGKQRLFEMMNRVAGMPLINEESGFSDLPPGFSPLDFIPLAVDIMQTPCDINTDINEEKKDDQLFDSARLKEFDEEYGEVMKIMQDEFRRKLHAYLTKNKQGISQLGRIHSGTLRDLTDVSKIIDRKTGKPIDMKMLGKKKFNVELEDMPMLNLDTLRDILLIEPSNDQLLGKNQKMAKSNFYNISLPALKSLIYHENSEKFYVLITCDKAKECIKWCYAQMGNYVMFDRPIRLKMQKLNYIVNNWKEWRGRIISEILRLESKNRKGEELVIRWHDSGDFISKFYLEIAIDIAKATPNVYHYAYTKEVSMIKSANIPQNFEFKFSLEGHERELVDKFMSKGVVVPSELFGEFLKEKPIDVDEKQWKESGMWQFTGEEKEIIKKRIIDYYNKLPDADIYNFNEDNVIWHDEYMQMPHDRTQGYERRWNVIIKPGDTDIPASRRDTIGILNLLHK